MLSNFKMIVKIELAKKIVQQLYVMKVLVDISTLAHFCMQDMQFIFVVQQLVRWYSKKQFFK